MRNPTIIVLSIPTTKCLTSSTFNNEIIIFAIILSAVVCRLHTKGRSFQRMFGEMQSTVVSQASRSFCNDVRKIWLYKLNTFLTRPCSMHRTVLSTARYRTFNCSRCNRWTGFIFPVNYRFCRTGDSFFLSRAENDRALRVPAAIREGKVIDNRVTRLVIRERFM